MTAVTTQCPVILCLLLILLLPLPAISQLGRGFSSTPDPTVQDFQPLMDGGDFTFGFRRVRGTLLFLAIVHTGDNLTHTPVWTANPSRPAKWAPSTELTFNGTLSLTDSGSVIWSTTGPAGDMLVFQGMANLQVVKGEIDQGHLWQSYDYPTETIVEGQNLTAGTQLVSSASRDDPSPGAYSLRLDRTGFGLYADFGGGVRLQEYWRREAMQEKAVVQPDGGPVYAQVSVNGFLGMYQSGSAPIDVLSFDSFQRRTGVRIIRLETDGNLKAYYWNVTRWALDFTAISDPCELPSACGQMGLCVAGRKCLCLNSAPGGDDTDSKGPTRCGPAAPAGAAKDGSCQAAVKELRTSGVDVPYKGLMSFETMPSLESCEESCARNCSCWAAVYHNASGRCYRLDYPVQTLLQVPDHLKAAYVKVVVPPQAVMVKRRAWAAAEVAVVVVACAVLVVVLGGLGHLWWWSKKRRFDGLLGEGLTPGSYRDLDGNSSGTVELSKR